MYTTFGRETSKFVTYSKPKTSSSLNSTNITYYNKDLENCKLTDPDNYSQCHENEYQVVLGDSWSTYVSKDITLVYCDVYLIAMGY